MGAEFPHRGWSMRTAPEDATPLQAAVRHFTTGVQRQSDT
jgi:hypothetical protein